MNKIAKLAKPFRMKLFNKAKQGEFLSFRKKVRLRPSNKPYKCSGNQSNQKIPEIRCVAT